MPGATDAESPGLNLVRKLSGRVTGRRAIDLFCGAGGMTVGLKAAGFSVVGAIDIDPVAIETYRANHKKSAVWQGDIRKLTGKAVLDELGLKKGDLDLLAGCPPCQGFSRMRTRNGKRSVQDKRNSLVDEFMRLVRELHPKAVMMENVPRLEKYPRLAAMQRELRVLGYQHDSNVVDAADFGVPQRRKRFIMLASRLEKIAIPSKKWQRRTVKDAIKALPRPRRLTKRGKPVFVHRSNPWAELHVLPPKRDPEIVKMIKRIPRNGGSRLDLPPEYQLDCHKRLLEKLEQPGFKDVYGRMAWDDVSPTITGGCINPSKGRFLHPTQSRAITLREAALLQTFPPGYRFSLSRGTYAAAVMIGNALPPVMIRRLGNGVAAHLDEHDA